MSELLREQTATATAWPKITRDTTVAELQEIHKRIWNYAAEYGKKPSVDYFSHCVACEWMFVHNVWDREDRDLLDCSKCLIAWPEGMDCRSKDSLYGLWYEYVNGYVEDEEEEIYEKKAKDLALQIRDLPFKCIEEELRDVNR